MMKNINCRWAKNPGGYCKNKLIKRSLFGFGARCCVKYWDDSRECVHQRKFDSPLSSVNVIKVIERVLHEKCYSIFEKHTHTDSGYNETFLKDKAYRELAEEILAQMQRLCVIRNERTN